MIFNLNNWVDLDTFIDDFNNENVFSVNGDRIPFEVTKKTILETINKEDTIIYKKNRLIKKGLQNDIKNKIKEKLNQRVELKQKSKGNTRALLKAFSEYLDLAIYQKKGGDIQFETFIKSKIENEKSFEGITVQELVQMYK